MGLIATASIAANDAFLDVIASALDELYTSKI
jgi:hypothetical protein